MSILKHTPPFSYFELIELCEQPGCPFCLLADKTVDRAIMITFDDGGVTDYDVRMLLRETLGYCDDHARYLIDPNRKGSRSPLGMSIIYRDIIAQIEKKLEATSYTPNKKMPFGKQIESQANTWFNRPKPQPNSLGAAQSLMPDKTCPICVRRDSTITLAIDTLVFKLAEEDAKLIEALEQADGICLPHLRQSIAHVKKPVALDHLKRLTLAKLATLGDELDEYKRKQDYRYQDEKLTPGERDAWQRAVNFMAGTGR